LTMSLPTSPAPSTSWDPPPPLNQHPETLLFKNKGEEWCGINHRHQQTTLVPQTMLPQMPIY
jgi:hypothetical protein